MAPRNDANPNESPRLYVNLDHVATVRQARGTVYPSVVAAAKLAESTGLIDGVTLHLREDRRHVNDLDMEEVKGAITLPFNYEMSVAEEIVLHCLKTKPAQATLVPERREEITTEGGLDLVAHGARVGEVTERLLAAGIIVSHFIDPDPKTVARAAKLGATHVELHTGAYAHHPSAAELGRLLDAALAARDHGVILNAGHGLTVENVGPVAALPHVCDLNIGHALIARALFVGLPEALREMRAAMDRGIAGSSVSEA